MTCRSFKHFIKWLNYDDDDDISFIIWKETIMPHSECENIFFCWMLEFVVEVK